MNGIPNHKIYGLVGYPLGHSFSRAFFTEKFREEGLGDEYLNFELPRFDHEILVALAAENPGLCGLNVTAPHKRAAYALADSLTPEAEDAGAANTLRLHCSGDGKLLRVEAHNTDVEGFREAIRPFLRPDIRNALVCGTGGAASAVTVALRQLGIGSILVSRNPAGRHGVISYQDIDARLLTNAPLIVNATPLGTSPATVECVPIPYKLLTDHNTCADLVYNPAETLFMRKAALSGAQTLNGAEMLRLQALASYKFWNK